MDPAEYIILFINLVLGIGLAWPLALRVEPVFRKPIKRRNLFVILILVYFLECVAFSASMGTNFMSVGLAFLWGGLFGLLLCRSILISQKLLKPTLLFSIYSGLPAASFLSVPLVAVIGGWPIFSVEGGARFGIPDFVPWPVNTLLGFCVTVSLTAVISKIIITMGIVLFSLRKSFLKLDISK